MWLRRLREAAQGLGQAFDASIRLDFIGELSPGWQAVLPELCLGAGVALAFITAMWLAVAVSPLTFFANVAGVATFNALLFLAVWFVLIPICVVLTVYAVKLVYLARRRR